ncbi:HMG-Y-related protein B-like [Trichechus manatus latirostris]|uniref:HMG-Y-related protein B-like n=1 Tax=Trichechus manatus latirostris TaxID=127582 RepID=A0A2Y9FVG3_TRIMA|nr:HMG-Y-related protein B-like [Trichechus manatus latirostris]
MASPTPPEGGLPGARQGLDGKGALRSGGSRRQSPDPRVEEEGTGGLPLRQVLTSAEHLAVLGSSGRDRPQQRRQQRQAEQHGPHASARRPGLWARQWQAKALPQPPRAAASPRRPAPRPPHGPHLVPGFPEPARYARGRSRQAVTAPGSPPPAPSPFICSRGDSSLLRRDSRSACESVGL